MTYYNVFKQSQFYLILYNIIESEFLLSQLLGISMNIASNISNLLKIGSNISDNVF